MTFTRYVVLLAVVVASCLVLPLHCDFADNYTCICIECRDESAGEDTPYTYADIPLHSNNIESLNKRLLRFGLEALPIDATMCPSFCCKRTKMRCERKCCSVRALPLGLQGPVHLQESGNVTVHFQQAIQEQGPRPLELVSTSRVEDLSW